MKLITVTNEKVSLSASKIVEDFVIKICSDKKSEIELTNSIKNKLWVFNVLNAKKDIIINIKDTSEQNLMFYLNGSEKVKITINTPKKLQKTGMFFISENNDSDEESLIELNLNESSNVDVSTLINTLERKKTINFKIKHDNKKTFSLARTVGVNNRGELKHIVNTIVRAPKGGCRQKLKIINFGKEANSECDPVLTIENNDIEYASHGATIGTFDSEHLFYLQSKGLSQLEAKKLLLKSNVIDLLTTINDEKERAFIATQFLSKVFLT